MMGMKILADGDRNLALFTENCMAFNFFDEEGLLEPENAALKKRLGRFQGNVERITLICVRHDDEVVAEFPAYPAHDANILTQVETDFDFDPMKALLRKSVS